MRDGGGESDGGRWRGRSGEGGRLVRKVNSGKRQGEERG